ncbi:ferric reduction oxidase 2-like [Magnolia sinica]|uniref:ferric reduction oxidase 2-like n=1 Tax=Magnolia sinica TaxID=86752 RepID=UPI00265B2014|nr:ferric reduction oxidase 2-like [Magnolia sinica]
MDLAKEGSISKQARWAILAAVRLLLGLVFLGVLLVWILRPTNLWTEKWVVKISTRVDLTTYFGSQGTNLLIFTFPVLFIAVLGCVYLHLGDNGGEYKGSYSNGKNRGLSSWTKPVLVKGPLGIVSAVELAFLFMFVALLIWSLSTTCLTIRFSDIHKAIVLHHHGHDNDKVWESKLSSAGFYFGFIGNICWVFLFFPVTRASSILQLVGLTSEASIKYHIWLGHMSMVLFTAHGLCYTLYWVVTNDLGELLKWDKVGVSNVAGELALLLGIAMWAGAFPRIRRRMFELFFYSHQLYILFVLFYILHIGLEYFYLILPGFYLFLIDRYLRFLQSRKMIGLVSARLLPCETIELNFSKSPGLTYNPTSMVFINVPSISSLQWHPFTVSSNSNLEPDRLSVIIKKEGDWSQKLCQMLSSPVPMDRLDVSIEGPYGPASVHFLRYDRLVLVSGGSGITPFISIIKEFIFMGPTLTSTPPTIVLISAFKTSTDLTMLDLLLPIAGPTCDTSHIQLQIEAFITQEKDPTIDNNKNQLQTIWFKPSPSDMPIKSIMGPNSWLWLGAVISTSFIMFLILLGITTRYYIYPIDHNTNNVYSDSARALLSMSLACVCIIAAASGAVLWNKKQDAKEVNQIQNMDVGTSTSLPSSWFYSMDRELESLPHQSLVQATKVHFGARPNLKNMLLESKGSSVGVMVSGPTEMRHEVAAICSSGVGNHLHFEAISFNW